MIPSLVQLAVRVLGKHFLAMESFRYIPDDFVERIFEQFLHARASLSVMSEADLTRIVTVLSAYHADMFCTSFHYPITNQLNFLTAEFYLQLLKCVQTNLVELDFSRALERYSRDEKDKFLNAIGQMERVEYLRLTYNRLDDDDVRLLTASHRFRSEPLANLHSLHLQGNHLASRSARFLKALTSLDTLYVSLPSPLDKSDFIREFDNLYECTCSGQNSWEEIINRGWIAKIPQLQSSATAVDHSFYRKRRRVDNDDSVVLIKLVRCCTTCQPAPSRQTTKAKEKSASNPTGFIDARQANDLLSCYL